MSCQGEALRACAENTIKDFLRRAEKAQSFQHGDDVEVKYLAKVAKVNNDATLDVVVQPNDHLNLRVHVDRINLYGEVDDAEEQIVRLKLRADEAEKKAKEADALRVLATWLTHVRAEAKLNQFRNESKDENVCFKHLLDIFKFF